MSEARRRRWLEGAAIAALVLAVYLPTLGYGFVWDDHEQVVDNPHLRSWSSLPSFWQQDVLALTRAGEQRSNYYRPLFFTAYLVLYQLFGPAAWAWHAVAVALHLAASLAALAFLRRLRLGEEVGFLGALLFAVHPAHGESVAWVATAFNDPPASALMLVGLVAHTKWLAARATDLGTRSGGATGGWPWLAAGAGCYAAALGFKEAALSMLALVPLTEHWLDRGRPLARRLAGVAPYLGVTAVYFVARKLVLTHAIGVFPGPGWGEVLPTLPRLGVEYLCFLVWPWGLAPSYPLRFVEGWGSAAAWGSVLVLAAVAAGIALAARRARVMVFGALWCLFCVAPAVNVRSFRPSYLVHQRYLYLAALGLSLILAWLLVEKVRRPRLRWGLAAALLVVWSASNLYHDRFWASDEALWQRVTEVDPGNPAAFDWLGARAMAEGRLDEAEALFQRSIAADPASPLGYRNLAVLLHARRREPARALPFYEQALAAFGGRAGLPEEAARTRVNYGACLAELGRGEEALAVFLTAAESPPFPAEAARNAAVLLRAAGRIEEARQVLRAAAARHPADPDLGRMLDDLERPRSATPPATR